MKEYYLYDSDFWNLGKTGALATLFFAIGSGCLGFAINAHMGISLASDLKPAVIAEWTAYRNVTFVISTLSFVLAIGLTLSGYNTVEKLKSQTSHGTEKYTPKSRYLIALGFFAIFSAIGFGIWLGMRVPH